MDCAVDENYYFKESEIKLLLAGIGVTRLYGLFSEKTNEKLGKEELHKNMAKLYQEDWIDWEDGQIAVKTPLSRILSVMERSQRCIIFKEKGKSVKCCYFTKEQAVVVEKSQREEESLRLSYCMIWDWILMIVKDMELSEGIADSTHREKITRVEDIKWEDETVKAVFSLQSSKKEQMHKRLIIWEEGLQTFLLLQNPKDSVRAIYKREILIRELEKWIQEGQA